MNSQSKKTKVNEDVVHEHDTTAKTMLILKTHVHVDDWSSVVAISHLMLHVLLNLQTPITRICPRILSNGLNESCLKTLESHDITE